MNLMSTKKFLFLLLSTTLVFCYSCKHEPDFAGTLQPVEPGGNNNGNNTGNHTASTCSKDSIYFVQQVLPIFQSSCAKSGCHDAGTHKENLILDSYSHIIASGGVNISNPANSKIYKVLVKTGEDRMPPLPAAALTSAQLSSISKWIGQGAKNNSCVESGCDTTNVKYSTHILPLMQNNCQGCHSGSAPDGGINLITYAGVKAVADNGKLFGAISHLNGYSAMPKNGIKLTDCQINIVKIWINQGSINN